MCCACCLCGTFAPFCCEPIDVVCFQLVLDVVPLTRVNSLEMLKAPDTPGRGVSRRGSLFRCNSIIDGNDLEVGGCCRLSVPSVLLVAFHD